MSSRVPYMQKKCIHDSQPILEAPDRITYLPTEVALTILSFMSLSDLRSFKGVNRLWRVYVQDAMASRCQKNTEETLIQLAPCLQRIKSYILDDDYQRIDDLANRLAGCNTTLRLNRLKEPSFIHQCVVHTKQIAV